MKETDDFLINGFFLNKLIINRRYRGQSTVKNCKMATVKI